MAINNNNNNNNNNNIIERINTQVTVFHTSMKKYYCLSNKISPDNGNYYQNFKTLSSPKTHQIENV